MADHTPFVVEDSHHIEEGSQDCVEDNHVAEDSHHSVERDHCIGEHSCLAEGPYSLVETDYSADDSLAVLSLEGFPYLQVAWG